MRYVQRTGDTRQHGGHHEHEQLHALHPVTQEAGAGFGVAASHTHPAELAGDNSPADHVADGQSDAGGQEQTEAGGVGAQVKAEQVFKIGQAVVAAKAHLVAEERQHQRKGKRLGDDGEVHPGHP